MPRNENWHRLLTYSEISEIIFFIASNLRDYKQFFSETWNCWKTNLRNRLRPPTKLYPLFALQRCSTIQVFHHHHHQLCISDSLPESNENVTLTWACTKLGHAMIVVNEELLKLWSSDLWECLAQMLLYIFCSNYKLVFGKA